MKRPDFPTPLYVGAHAHISLHSEVALRVHKGGCADLYLPVDHCSRLVVSTHAHIEPEALKACVLRQIPIIWQQANGSALAACLPCHPDMAGWAQITSDALAHASWRKRYASWLAAQYYIARRALGEYHHCAAEAGQERAWLDTLMHKQGVRRAWGKHALNVWRAAILGMVLEQWQQYRIPLGGVYAHVRGWNLAADIADCVALDMLHVLIRQRRHWQTVRALPRVEAMPYLIQAVEKRKPRLLRLADDMRRRFIRWLLEWDEWR